MPAGGRRHNWSRLPWTEAIIDPCAGTVPSRTAVPMTEIVEPGRAPICDVAGCEVGCGTRPDKLLDVCGSMPNPTSIRPLSWSWTKVHPTKWIPQLPWAKAEASQTSRFSGAPRNFAGICILRCQRCQTSKGSLTQLRVRSTLLDMNERAGMPASDLDRRVRFEAML